MQINQISSNNGLKAYDNKQCVLSKSSVASFKSVEQNEHKIKENSILKYSLICTGALSAIIVALNYKKIGTFFNKSITKVQNGNIAKKDFVPANKLLGQFGKPYVDTENYELWHFTSDEFLQKFVKAHDDVYDSYKKTGLDEYGLWDLKSIRDYTKQGREEFVNFVSRVKDKIGVDLTQEVKHYRFIGKSELDAIRSKGYIESLDYGRHIYVSLCPEPKYNVPPRWDYRITFKNTDNIANNMGPYHKDSYKSAIEGAYYFSDIEKVEKRVNGQWQKVSWDDNEDNHRRVMVKVKQKN